MSDAPKKRGALATGKSRTLWTLAAIAMAVVTVLVVLSQNQEFSFSALWESLREANVWYLGAAVASSLCICLAEAQALRVSCRALGHPCRYRRSVVYSAADLYFSAITPSASGGQPLCAALMMRDGIPGAVSTAALLATLSMYTMSLLLLGIVALALFPNLFFALDPASQIFIAVGYCIFLALTVFFLLLLKNEALLRKMCTFVVKLGAKLRILRHPERTLEKLGRSMDEYGRSVASLRKKKRMFFVILGHNLLQRLATSLVPFFVALSGGATLGQAFRLWGAQIYSMIGSNCLPIPGSMGVADYLMLRSFELVLPEAQAVSLELVSRALSFYFVVILCGTLVLVDHIVHLRRKKQ